MFYRKSTYISILLFFLGIVFIVFGSSFGAIYTDVNVTVGKPVINNRENVIHARNEKIVNVNLSFIGDSLVGSFKGENYSGNFRDLLEKNDYSFPYKNVLNIFREDDFTIANGENVFTDKNLLPVEKNHNPAYWYYAPTRFANVYKESSIEIVSVMNNHSYDYGYDGYIDTKNAIKATGVMYGDESPLIIEKEDIKIGILCINLFSRFQYENCIKDIKKIRNDVNYIIIYFHGGTEYLYHPPLEIIEYSHGFIDNGADLVIGAHPHVLQPKEVYNNKIIIYSLGSFLFGGTRSFVNRTIIYQMNLEFHLDKNTIVEKDNIIPCYLYSSKDFSNYESWLPSVIETEEEKKKVIDFMNGLIDKPI